MIKSVKNTEIYKSLNLSKNLHHAYLFFSLDKDLNNNIALAFAKSLACSNLNDCGQCDGCKQFDSLSHPDVSIIDQNSIKVEDVNNLVAKLNTLPISSEFKVFVILNAENINEIAQNKLLKSLEEPNPKNVFILSTSKLDKILPTVLSRLHKINLPKIDANDLKVLQDELFNQNININKYLNSNLSLSEILNLECNDNHKKTIQTIKYIFENLNMSSDIPKVCNSLPEFDKTIFFSILQKLFMSCINNEQSYDEYLITLIKKNYPAQALINSLPLIEKAYQMQMANVNFSYILDNLLFDILKEKFLCKQSN